MEGLAAPFFIASALLALAGGSKLARPEPTAGALRSIGLPGRRWIAQMLGAAEVLIGAWALVIGGSLAAAAVAAAYSGFAGFIVFALRKGGAVSSCGCFGTEDSPPTIGHLALNVFAAAVALVVVLEPFGGLPDVMGNQPALGAPLLGFVGIGTWLAYLALSLLPTLVPREAS